MVQSSTERVTVAKLDSELTIEIDRVTGPPGDITITGKLYRAGSIVVIGQATIELYVNGGYVGSNVTNNSGEYIFSATVEEGGYTIYTSWMGNETYNQDSSPPITANYGKIQAAISISVSPSSGAPPMTVTISGRLSAEGVSLVDKIVDLYREGVKIDSKTTISTDLGLDSFTFTDTINSSADYYVKFAGDDQYKGCDEDEDLTLLCLVCGHGIPSAILGSEVECEVCHSVFETVIV